MTTTGRSAALLLLLAASDLGCINVSALKVTVDGGFQCSVNSPLDCPSTHACDPITSTCRPRTFADAAPIEHPSMDAPVAASETGDDRGGSACFMPVARCTPGAGKCDPVCQTGCGCQEKCLSNTMGTLTCSVPVVGRSRVIGEGCNVFAPGSATQSDDCAPGLVCLADGCGDRCYKYCKTDGDCPMSSCTRDAGGGVKICDVPNVACNPITNNGVADGCGTSSDSLTCWLSSSGTDQTFCDCPGMFSIGRPNTTCTATRDCFPGLVCVGLGTPLCRQVCSLTNNSADCQGGRCTAIGNNAKFGYCN